MKVEQEKDYINDIKMINSNYHTIGTHAIIMAINGFKSELIEFEKSLIEIKNQIKEINKIIKFNDLKKPPVLTKPKNKDYNTGSSLAISAQNNINRKRANKKG
jgi:hypothetical protein